MYIPVPSLSTDSRARRRFFNGVMISATGDVLLGLLRPLLPGGVGLGLEVGAPPSWWGVRFNQDEAGSGAGAGSSFIAWRNQRCFEICF